MKPFEKVNIQPKSNEEIEKLISHVSKVFRQPVEQVLEIIGKEKEKEIWVNDQFQVVVRKVPTIEKSTNLTIIHLSIKRIDKQPIHSWRALQQIKNMLVGEENFGMEIYPNESDLVDTANQYHLWVFEDPSIRLPFGFNEGRCVSDIVPEGVNVNQNPFNYN